MSKFKYPNFEPQEGYLTNLIRNEYIATCIKNETKLDPIKFNKIISLVASNDINDKIYFWQLYSILGEKPVHNLILKFYTNIFNDTENLWFREEFEETGSINYHVKGQKKFWLDIMGGGPQYIGGELKLHRKHELVSNIMTLEGAEIWMKHMNDTIHETRFDLIKDKRVIPCIKNFLHFFMKKYSVEFDFNFYGLIKKKYFSRL